MKKFALSLLVFFCAAAVIAPCYASDRAIDWTEDEKAFLSEHPVIRLGADPEFVPFEFIDKDGAYKGIAADYLSLISRKTGLIFEVAPDLTWQEAYEMALSGELDMLPAISKTSEREQYFLFSQPYYYFKRVIVTRDTDTGISEMEDLYNLTVAVQRNSSHHSYLLSYPEINLSLYDSLEAALTAVANGSERAFVGNLASANYLIRSNGLTNLRFAAFEAEKQQALHIAVRSDWPELVGILNKALDAITEEEKIGIQNKWIDLDSETDYGPIIRVIVVISALVAVILSVSFYWIIRLRKEIKKRQLIQADLEQAKREADEANEFKSGFMARMSHEIRTPLNAITGMAYLLKKTDISPTQKMYADRITQASGNMLNIINDILDFSKIEAGKAELEIASFSMDRVIQNVVNIVSYKIEEQEIGFRLSKDPQIPDWFFGDAKRIEQILLNLLNNAAKFTSAGEVSLELRLTAKENDLYHLLFSVKDTGIGMTKEQTEKLFTPFVQGDSSINRRFGGSGLGLAIVKSLLDLMGGPIQVYSAPGEGSTFLFSLSLLVDGEKESDYAQTISSKYFKNVQTLVLEKSGASMNLIESYLSAFGMHCELTSTQAGATSLLETANGNASDNKFSKPFDLLILDFDTPLEGGFRYVQALRENNRISKFPKIILLLPMMRADLFDRLSEYGIDLGVGKPIIPSVLLNGILDLFNLKALSASQPSAEKKPEPSGPPSRYRVLLAEDNKTNQLIASSLLRQAGIDSLIANDGEAAVSLFRQHQAEIDLILMDLHMPVMNGYEAAQKIRTLSSGIPIVAMTADVILGVREKCEQSGIHHYISKPFDPDRFIQTVRGLIEGHKEANPRVRLIVLDQADGLKSMGEDQNLYREVLEAYFRENQDTVSRLDAAISEQHYHDAGQIVHKVKGSSGSIGAKALLDISKALQEALREEKIDAIASLTGSFSQTMDLLLTEISKLLR